LPAYAICYLERRHGSPHKANDVVAQWLAARWNSVGFELEGFWVVQADATSDQIRDELVTVVPEGHGFIVLSLGQDAAWAGVAQSESNWFVENL
jgi:hypothetical protein